MDHPFRIGNQTAASAPSPGVPFDFALDHAFRAFEWFPDKTWTETDLDAGARADIRKRARENDVLLSVHAPLGLDPLSPETSLPPEPALGFACDIGAVLFNIHLQPEKGIDIFLTSIEYLIRRTRELDIRLALENTPVTAPEDFNTFFNLLRKRDDLPSDHVGVCFDLGHANLCEATRNDYLGFIDRLDAGTPVIHLHLHENYGDRDAHIPLFTGPSKEDDRGIRKLLDRLARRGFRGAAIMEVWPDPPELLTEARDRLESLLPDPLKPGDGSSKEMPPDPAPGPHADNGNTFTAELLAADRRLKSWREKLRWVGERLADDSRPPAPDDLAALAVYLRWLHTGRISCDEDSRHFRPSHHAKAAAAVAGSLKSLDTPETAPIIRRIHPYLPSYDAPFLRAEPLTRIRDIAHRNDIPGDLKKEIKHRLQNKLHRCAGPEDLQTSKDLLERITAPGAGYPEDFVHAFRTFHEELKSFFNAQDLEIRLADLIARLPLEARQAISGFLNKKTKGYRSLPDGLSLLESLTDLRTALVAAADDPSGASDPSCRLAEIDLESFAFVVCSDLINRLQESAALPWEQALRILSLILAHLRLSRLFPAESAAVQAENDVLIDAFGPDDRDSALRLKASLDRTQRLCDRVANSVLATFQKQATELGKALGVSDSAIGLFCEAEVRESITFQLSKLTSLLGKQLQTEAFGGKGPWEPIVPGRAAGLLVHAKTLSRTGRNDAGPAIVLLDSASGDEAVPPHVAGIILGREIPHLSHLSVRARQAATPLVFSEDTQWRTSVEPLIGQRVLLEVTGDSFRVTPDDGRDSDARPSAVAEGSASPPVDLDVPEPALPVDRTTDANAGGKAGGLRRLGALAERCADFKVPPALVVPFGVLAAAFEQSPETREWRTSHIRDLDTLSDADRAASLDALRRLILQLPVPEEITEAASKTFGPDVRLIARSSSNAEDLEHAAAAGIYESVPNLPAGNLADGIRRVWASLWTDEAFLNRRQTGLRQEDACMAVVIQPFERPDISFILHTTNPVSQNRDEVYIEAAPGFGELLAGAGEAGAPWRMVADTAGKSSRMLAFANFSHELVPGAPGRLERRVADYSASLLSNDPEFRKNLCRRLAKIAGRVEDALGAPQDIEGFLLDDRVCLVQSRPQLGLERNPDPGNNPEGVCNVGDNLPAPRPRGARSQSSGRA